MYHLKYLPAVRTKILWNTAQKTKFSIKDFFTKCDQIRRKLLIWSHLLQKFLIENFIFCEVKLQCQINKVFILRNRDITLMNVKIKAFS